MNIKIDNVETTVINAEQYQQYVAIYINKNMADLAEFKDECTITMNGTEYLTSVLKSAEKGDGFIRIRWELQDPNAVALARSEAALAQAEANNATLTAKLNAIQGALTELLTGIPTISEYKALVKTIKEVFGIE